MAHNIIDADPNDPRLLLPNVEFYITNVCNLTCTNCNRFNDYDFKGWQRWRDYESLHEEWAKKIRLQRVTILGGEPLLNPTVLDWVDGINRLWNKPVQILTNGTQLNRVPNLYDRLIKFAEPGIMARNWIGISLHNLDDKEKCFEEIRLFLKGDVQYVHKDDPINIDNAYTMGSTHAFYDSNGMRVCVWEYDDFYTSAVKRDQFGQLTLHNSDPFKAHQGCGFVMFKCFHFIRGQIYRCGPVALFPEFDQQHPLAINTEDRELINSYKPLTVDSTNEQIRAFFDQNEPLAQCKFCPENFTMTRLKVVSKKTGSTSMYD